MRVFVIAVVAAVVAAVASAYFLQTVQKPVNQAYTTAGARIGADY